MEESPSLDPTREEEPSFKPPNRVLVIVLAACLVLAVALLVLESRQRIRSTVPHLVGTSVDPAMDTVAFQLEVANLVLGDVTQTICPPLVIPGTVVNQHPQGGKIVALGTAVDVTVCRSENVG